MAAADPMAGRCTALSKQRGERCARQAIPGGTVCYWHGGKAPQVQFKAQERLQALQPSAVRRIGHWIDQEEFPTVSLGACKDVLDRTIGKAAEIVELHQHIDLTITERLLKARQRLHGE